MVAFENKDHRVVGREAYRLALTCPQDTLFDFKLKLGSQDVVYTDAHGKTYSAADLAALCFRKIKADVEQALGQPIEKVVVTCPANFQDDARQALIQAAERAGLKVLRLMAEPTAAAMAYGLQRGSGSTILVFDLGGGTFDVSVAKCQPDRIEVLGTSGIPTLGSRQFDQCIADYVRPELARQFGFEPDSRKDPAFFEDLREPRGPANNRERMLAT